MFKKGDRIVCINNKVKSYNDKLDMEINMISKKIKQGNIYIVENPNAGGGDLKLDGIDAYYLVNKFIPLEEYRFIKLNKIKKIFHERSQKNSN